MAFFNAILRAKCFARKRSIIIVAALVSLSVFCWVWRLGSLPKLVQLQRQILLARTEADRNKVIAELERYYMTLPIPRKIHEIVDLEFQKRLAQGDARENCPKVADAEPTAYQL